MRDVAIRVLHGPCANEIRETGIASLKEHTVRAGGVALEEAPFSVLAYLEDRLVGGLLGKTVWNWLYADLVWVQEDFRGRGIGTRVMKKAEERARELKLTGLYLWTESWQAPTFYRKLGYEQFAEFRNFPPGHNRLGFRKYLT